MGKRRDATPKAEEAPRNEVEDLKRKKAALSRKLTAVQARAQTIKAQRPADMALALGRCSVDQRRIQDELTELKADIYAASTAAQWSTEEKIAVATARIAGERVPLYPSPVRQRSVPEPALVAAPTVMAAPPAFRRVARAASAYIANGARSRRMDLVEALEELDRQFPEWWGKRT